MQGLTSLPDYVQFKHYDRTPLNQIFTAAGDDLLEVLESMLAVDPQRRCTATQVCLANNEPIITPIIQVQNTKTAQITDKIY